ncbi:hypothetical protein COT65_01665 [Candidatus Shapirobacteria bacterium CG09_land_8_20_14_0_10_47_13]|uniref:Aspartate racemase n=1 Tax=Candidatus Shapirobacteria bacterium CG09_land_8_20_14_0_10_47_13 TaxID=1974481 RepID=A0A2H0WMQ3_9BACT|nr:MAG: hypothetical protein COT65_01665 [Candidatus Shapirobacteria bacterium CG09_land_8_20_14_0_10_47_13]
MNKKAIGIIGGMGPEASQHFYKLLIYYAQKDYGVVKNGEFPEIYLASIPVQDFINSNKKQKEALKMLKSRVRQMNKLPISFFCLACNTAHLLIDELRKETNKPFVSLLEELPAALLKSKIKKVGLLATPTAIKSEMYQEVMKKKGLEVVVPDDGDQRLLGKIIAETIAGKNYEENGVKVQKIARTLLDRGAEGIIEACTEIPLIFPKQHLVPVFDTLDILAKAVLERYYLLK